MSVVFALSLPMLLWFMAMVADLGHGWQVRNQLQNASDGAALAGVRMLDGTSTGVANVATAISTVAAAHNANGSSVSILSSDIQYGSWDFTARKFTNLGSNYTPTTSINAIKVTARRDSSTSKVSTWFASAVGGSSSMEVTTTSIAAGGGASEPGCGFPITIASCSLLDGNGNFKCPNSLTFSGQNSNVGVTIYTTTSPVNGNNQTPYIQNAVPPNNKCSNFDSLTGGQVYVQNGNDPTAQSVAAINTAVQQYGAFDVDLAVVDVPNCGNVQMKQLMTIDGWLRVKITGASNGNNKSITMTGDCGQQDSNGLPGAGYFGLWSSNPYIVQ